MLSRIRAAVKVSKPPLMFILEDPQHVDWTMWDFRLAKAIEIHADMTQGGVPIYWDRSDRVVFTAESYVSKSKAALDRAEEKAQKGKSKNYGKVFYPLPRTVDDGPLPTLEEYLEEQRVKKAMSAGNFRINPESPFSNSPEAPELD